MSASDDADYWGLTPWERVHFHARLSDYHGQRSRVLGEKAARHGRKARIALTVSLILQGLALALRIIGQVTHG